MPTSRPPGQTPTGPFTLASLGLLQVVEPVDGQGNRQIPRVPLGFEPGLLPSFAPPPSDLDNLNLLYGSCRRPGHDGPDALAMCDDLIFGDDRYKDPRARPHQLFLGGDQVYADDVDTPHMMVVFDAAVRLIGTTPEGDPQLAGPVEHLRLDTILAKDDETTVVDPNDPAAAYHLEDPVVTAVDPDLPADRAHFPEEVRFSTTRRDAQFTSVDGINHMMSLGEFAALYLSVWSNAIWGTQVPGGVTVSLDPANPGNTTPLFWDDDLPPGAIINLPPVVYPDRIAGHLYVAPAWQSETDPVKRDKARQAWLAELEEKAAKRPDSLRRLFRIIRDFRRTLPKVQRVLANVPTYMIMDDHDITDDYFLNPMWRDRVLTAELGQAILRNAMVAYALFQDWGNDPRRYQTGPRAQLMDLVPNLFPLGSVKGPDQSTCDQIAHLLGHDLNNTLLPTGRYTAVSPPIQWHFMIDGPRHRVVALDNRTRRSYVSLNGPPGNVAVDAMVDQIPLPPLPAGREILIVVAPLPVIGPSVLDDIVAPMLYRIFDAVEAKDSQSDILPSSTTGLRGMIGTNPDAIEAWAFDPETFEHLLARLEPYRRVVLLSGDVHYSTATAMSYWRGDDAEPARFAQFTASGLKNVMPTMVTFVDRSLGMAHQLIRANLGTERLGWLQPADDLILLPPGTDEFELVPVMRSRLKSVPVLLPTWGWPEVDGVPSRINPARPPDWRWLAVPVLDDRLDGQRPPGIRTLPVDDGAIDAALSNPDTVLAGYQAIAARHQHALHRLRNSRQIMFRANVGRVRFHTHEDGKLDAIHEVYTTFADPDLPAPADPKPEPFMVQVAPLYLPAGEKRPGELRRKALEIPAPEGDQ
jgi:hypothetical protein